MEEVPKRYSMNTSLKNARIFDEDSWDAETAGFICKTEVDVQSDKSIFKSEPADTDTSSSMPDVKVKQEVEQFDYNGETANSFTNDFKPQLFGVKIKKENEDSYDSIKSENEKKIEILSTPIKTELKSDIKPSFIMDNSNPSPFTKEHFTHFCLDSPKHDSDIKSETRKSYKRTIFTRNSPYKNDVPDYLRTSVKDRLGPPVENDSSRESSDSNKVPVKKRLGSIEERCEIPKKRVRKIETETDPEILARRQKQIDYGKNTLGYDNYIRKVGRLERSQDDPKTPNKLLKYSRRAWDGLIKQWRLKLHKYDDE